MLNRLKNRYFKKIILSITVFCLLVLCQCSGIQYSKYYEKVAIVSACPIATDAGLEIYKKGGNAFDVAVAIGFTLAVTYPEAGNIGGGGFALIRSGANKKVEALDFREKAPLAATVNMYLDENGDVVSNASTIGALSSGVPGTVAGLYALWEKYGSLEWKELIQPAVDLADNGFSVNSYLAESFKKNKELFEQFSSTEKIFLPDNQTLKENDKFVQKDLAGTLRQIAFDGPDVFYKGEIARLIVKTMNANNGLISLEDLQQYDIKWREPVKFKFDSLEIYSMVPPSSGGYVIGQILKLLEPFDFSKYFYNSPEYIHLFCEASKRAFADRSVHLGDPDFYNISEGLLDESYLSVRRDNMDTLRITPVEQVVPGTPENKESDQTTHFSVADEKGNMIALTYTINASYGSGLVIDSAGFLMNNEMDDFSIKQGSPNLYGLIGGEANKIEPGKRMLSSMSPTLVFKNNNPYMILGSPGGSKIITIVAQAIINHSRFKHNADETVNLPRFHHQWMPDILYLEENSFDIITKQNLISRGYDIKERSKYGDLQIITYDNGLMTASSDPRKQGKASGF
ncbi:MAG: gamma-glutamyltransferase [Candidatus Zixiibacteriota bacterium]|nr:MAG: gamma-glutamyltransferase [candidate division Zixibacteria bacterium]